jgi:8-oxo-dGTP pyrophosphatase MutT (NUDIX family)
VDPSQELVDVVGEDDHVVEVVTRGQLRARNLLHRCTYVLVRRADGRVLVHRRTETKDVYPGAYDMFAGGVLASGEAYDDGARRELEEELGIGGAPLTPLFRHRYSGPSGEVWGAVYEAVWDGPVIHQESEVSWSDWVTLDELDGMLAEREFCLDSREIFERLRDGRLDP